MKIIKSYFDVKANDFQELMQVVGRILYKDLIVKKSFSAKIIRREKRFPTGLELENINVAIPHTNPEFVNKSGIVFVKTLKKIKMIKMATIDDSIYVDTFFILLVNDGKLQMTVLENLINKLKDKSFLKILENIDESIIKNIDF